MDMRNLMTLAHAKTRRLINQGYTDYKTTFRMILKRLHYVNNLKCDNSY